MEDLVKLRLRSEWLSINMQHLSKTLSSISLPNIAMKDHMRAVLLYKKYQEMIGRDTSIRVISKPCFLYVWLCFRSHRSSGVYMRDYSFFGDESVNMSRVSYRDFTQAFVDSSSDPLDYDDIYIHYSGEFATMIRYKYPISLRCLLDRIHIDHSDDYALLSEGDMLYIKTKPELMGDTEDTIKLSKRAEQDILLLKMRTVDMRSDHVHSMLVAETLSDRDELLSMLQSSMAISSVNHMKQRHIFSFPNREIHYTQIIRWLITKKIPHSSMEESQHIVVDNFMDGSKYEFLKAKLEENKRYIGNNGEMYRLKGDKMLQIVVHSYRDKEYLRSTILGICKELDMSVSDEYPDPLELDATNIAKLRATNSLVFDSLYCRKAPPGVQPLVIKESEIQDALDKGKMVLRYKNMLYTTRDSDISNGHDYIGMINKFGDYNPTEPYIPVIRTYKTNHLLSKNFKELKAYLLRHSNHPNMGHLSKEDILLPESLEWLYRVTIINPDTEVVSIHSKKITISNSNKVCTGEVPDSIKALLGTSNAKRIIELSKGSGLLNICGVDTQEALLYFINNRTEYLDMISLGPEDIRRDIETQNIDHRLYGKAIEDITGLSLIVFSIDGLVPYRYSRCERGSYLLLFRTELGTYDRIVVDVHSSIKYNLSYLRDICNEAKTVRDELIETQHHRPIDYTFVCIRLIGYISNIATSLGISVSYELIHESKVEDLIESVYKMPIYYEGFVDVSKYERSEASVTIRGQKCRIDPTMDLLSKVLSPMIKHLNSKRLVLYSPVDMSRYNTWNFLLEDCLYYSSKCYSLGDREEILCVDKGYF